MDPENLFEPHPLRPQAGRKLGRSERIALAAAERRLQALHAHVYARELAIMHIPKAWTELPDAHEERPKKVRVTLLLDPSVAKFYRGYGRGYQALVNDVLATYAQLRVAKVLQATKEGEPGGFSVR